jgi:hypothetical protein
LTSNTKTGIVLEIPAALKVQILRRNKDGETSSAAGAKEWQNISPTPQGNKRMTSSPEEFVETYFNF